MGANWRPSFDPRIVHDELEIIKNDLHCNAIRICGLDIDRLIVATEDALTQGLEVWLSPEMWDRAPEETLEYIAKAANAAETLRCQWPDQLIFSLGSELTLFMKGIVEGNNLFERMNKPSFWEDIGAGKHNGRLNAFLAEANGAVRDVFRGPVTYFSVPFETVEWGPLDFVGVDLYRDATHKEVYGGMARKYTEFNKPALVGEFGCCTYQGAERLGGNGFVIMFGMMAPHLNLTQKLPKSIVEMTRIPTQVDGHYVRDESLQAQEITEQLSALDSAGVDGAFVFTFVTPSSPYASDPKFDGDMASFSLVRSYAEKWSAEGILKQTARQGKEILGVDIDPSSLADFLGDVGRRGETYPKMPWEPKKSFYAVQKYYSSLQRKAAAGSGPATSSWEAQ